MAKEPKVRIKFQHAENPGKDVEFNAEGQYYHLKDGEEVSLPISVVRHLNSLKYPIYDYGDDGKIKQAGERNRFNCIQLELLEPKNMKEAANG
jgi:hypothetical protein